MRNLQVFNEANDVLNLKDEIDRLFFGLGRKMSKDANLSTWAPPVDISEDKEAIKFHFELPGMKKEDVKISIENNVLTVKGEKTFKEEEKKKNYHRVERSYGMFERSFTLPNGIETTHVGASMKDGVLEIMVPKKEEAKPKEIEIKIG